jgi:hypothetical protein
MSGYQFLSENSSFIDKIRNFSKWHHPVIPPGISGVQK